MKKFLKFLLPLSVILLSGYSELSGHTREESALISAKPSDGSPNVFYNAAQDCEELVIKPGQSEYEKASSLNHTANVEEKEDELSSSKRSLEFTTNLHIDFHTLTAGYFHHCIKSNSFFSKGCSYFPSYNSLLLLIGVLRI